MAGETINAEDTRSEKEIGQQGLHDIFRSLKEEPYAQGLGLSVDFEVRKSANFFLLPAQAM